VAGNSLTTQLLDLGVRPGGVLVVHTAFSKLAPLAGGPMALIRALQDALGGDGTLVMPSMSDDDDHPFDATSTPCKAMGVVAETFWRLPGVQRSNSPHAFAAAGPRAGAITAPHPPDVPHGVDSPVGRAWQLDSQVLLLGVGHDANTTIHLAENLAGVRYGQRKRLTVLRDARPARLDYFEVDHCCQKFAQLDEWLDQRGLQARGPVASGGARLARSQDIVETALEHLRADETVFLHAPGECDECDASRQALGSPATTVSIPSPE
jgi:aminoglycoside N3'-acetyltransferase